MPCRSIVAGGSGLLLDWSLHEGANTSAVSCVVPTLTAQSMLSVEQRSSLSALDGLILSAPSPTSPPRCYALATDSGFPDVVALRRGPLQRDFSNGQVNGQGEVEVDWPGWLEPGTPDAPAANLQPVQRITLDPPIKIDESLEVAILHHWLIQRASSVNGSSVASAADLCTPVCLRINFRTTDQLSDVALGCVVIHSCDA